MRDWTDDRGFCGSLTACPERPCLDGQGPPVRTMLSTSWSPMCWDFTLEIKAAHPSIQFKDLLVSFLKLQVNNKYHLCFPIFLNWLDLNTPDIPNPIFPSKLTSVTCRPTYNLSIMHNPMFSRVLIESLASNLLFLIYNIWFLTPAPLCHKLCRRESSLCAWLKKKKLIRHD